MPSSRHLLAGSLVLLGLFGLTVGELHADDPDPRTGKTDDAVAGEDIPLPAPLLAAGEPVPWWFVFKFNAKEPFDGCPAGAERACPFGGEPQAYPTGYGQQYVMASATSPTLQAGTDCLGDATTDPIGATFDQVYNSTDLFYVVWNDQFYGDPAITGCGDSCSAPWGHSKGIAAWNAQGQGFVMQVSTPSWPASGNTQHPRTNDGNSLGCVEDDDVKVSQHFFALALTHSDLVDVLQALANASVVTDTKNPQIVRNGGPTDVQAAAAALGKKSSATSSLTWELSSGVTLISKPSDLNVPPWQMVSALLAGTPLRTATWWTSPAIPGTTDDSLPGCWDASLQKPGPVQIATTGTWDGHTIGLKGGAGTDYNHAKLGVSTDGTHTYSILGDMNQQGTLSPSDAHKCTSSQNGRGGLFYVLDDPDFHASLSALLAGDSG